MSASAVDMAALVDSFSSVEEFILDVDSVEVDVPSASVGGGNGSVIIKSMSRDANDAMLSFHYCSFEVSTWYHQPGVTSNQYQVLVLAAKPTSKQSFLPLLCDVS